MISESGLERQTTHVDEGHQIRSDQLCYDMNFARGNVVSVTAGRSSDISRKEGGEERGGQPLNVFYENKVKSIESAQTEPVSVCALCLFFLGGMLGP
jgi:hypothetical protein